MLGSGYSKTKSYTNARFLGATCCAYTLKQHNYYWKSYTRGSIEATSGHHSWLLVAKNAKGRIRIRKEMRSMIKVHAEHASTGKSP